MTDWLAATVLARSFLNFSKQSVNMFCAVCTVALAFILNMDGLCSCLCELHHAYHLFLTALSYVNIPLRRRHNMLTTFLEAALFDLSTEKDIFPHKVVKNHPLHWTYEVKCSNSEHKTLLTLIAVSNFLSSVS